LADFRNVPISTPGDHLSIIIGVGSDTHKLGKIRGFRPLFQGKRRSAAPGKPSARILEIDFMNGAYHSMATAKRLGWLQIGPDADEIARVMAPLSSILARLKIFEGFGDGD
jgi:hypothetical protein